MTEREIKNKLVKGFKKATLLRILDMAAGNTELGIATTKGALFNSTKDFIARRIAEKVA